MARSNALVVAVAVADVIADPEHEVLEVDEHCDTIIIGHSGSLALAEV